MRFAVTPCDYLFLVSVSSEKNRWLTTQPLDQYALIVFRRVLDSVVECCFKYCLGNCSWALLYGVKMWEQKREILGWARWSMLAGVGTENSKTHHWVWVGSVCSLNWSSSPRQYLGLRIHHCNNLSFWYFVYTQCLQYLVW